MYVENTPAIAEFPNQSVPPRGRVVRTAWARSLLTFLMVFGPGPVVMEADNDAGALSLRPGRGAAWHPDPHSTPPLVSDSAFASLACKAPSVCSQLKGMGR